MQNWATVIKARDVIGKLMKIINILTMILGCYGLPRRRKPYRRGYLAYN